MNSFNIYDMLVFEDLSGNIYQDCICEICNKALEKYIKCNRAIIYLDNNDNITRIHIGSKSSYYLKEIWTRIDEYTYKKVWELKSLLEYEYSMNYFYREYQKDINLGCDEVDLAKSRRAYEQAKDEYEQAKKVYEELENV